MRKTKKRRRGSGTAGIMIIVLAFLVVMTVQICRIRSKDAEYAAKEKELQQPTTTQLLMSDAIKHECGIALLRLKKPLEFYKEKYGNIQYYNG
mgnify:CR=1 FL=1